MRIDLVKAPVLALCLSLPVVCPPSVASREKTYTAQNEEVVDVLSLVFKAEGKANGWTKDMVVCFSINGLDPNPKLVKSLRQRKLNARRSGEWAKRFNCGFELQLELPEVPPDTRMKVRTKVVDLRDINTGQGDLAIIDRDGEYLLEKIDAKWSINEYEPLDMRGPTAAPKSEPHNQ